MCSCAHVCMCAHVHAHVYVFGMERETGRSKAEEVSRGELIKVLKGHTEELGLY